MKGSLSKRVVTTQNKRKKGQEEGDRTCLLFSNLQKRLDSAEKLDARNLAAASEVRDTPGTFGNIRSSMCPR